MCSTVMEDVSYMFEHPSPQQTLAISANGVDKLMEELHPKQRQLLKSTQNRCIGILRANETARINVFLGLDALQAILDQLGPVALYKAQALCCQVSRRLLDWLWGPCHARD